MCVCYIKKKNCNFANAFLFVSINEDAEDYRKVEDCVIR